MRPCSYLETRSGVVHCYSFRGAAEQCWVVRRNSGFDSMVPASRGAGIASRQPSVAVGRSRSREAESCLPITAPDRVSVRRRTRVKSARLALHVADGRMATTVTLTPRRAFYRQQERIDVVTGQILASLGSESLLRLGDELAGGVGEQAFLRLMLQTLSTIGVLGRTPALRREQATALVYLFRSMDLNGNGDLEFSELLEVQRR